MKTSVCQSTCTDSSLLLLLFSMPMLAFRVAVAPSPDGSQSLPRDHAVVLGAVGSQTVAAEFGAVQRSVGKLLWGVSHKLSLTGITGGTLKPGQSSAQTNHHHHLIYSINLQQADLFTIKHAQEVLRVCGIGGTSHWPLFYLHQHFNFLWTSM